MNPIYFDDPSDKYDSEKWDFDESDIPVYKIDKYYYLTYSKKNALRLHDLRNKINQLCNNIQNNIYNIKKTTKNKEYLNGVQLFLDLHKEYYYDPNTLPEPFFEIAINNKPTSRYMLSEIPSGTKFSGLNKPRMRYEDNTLPNIGKDKKIRAYYRHIFLDLKLYNKDLIDLIIHELAHSMANHVTYRPDDHNEDFIWCENIIKKYWPN